MTAPRVVVIGGGTSSEHEVSLASAAGIADALDPERFDVVRLGIRPDGTWTGPEGPLPGDLAGAVAVLERADVVVPALHGPRGEDGTLAALLDLVGVPYVGSGVVAGAVAMSKHATKAVAAAVGVASADGILVHDARDPRLAGLKPPLVVKPDRAGSSHGVTVVREAGGLAAAVQTALAFDTAVLVERFVRGREIDVAVIEHADGSLRCLPPLEIVVPEGGIFDAEAKYAREPDFRVPAPVPPALLAELEGAALAVFRAVGARGLARVDFFATDAGLLLNELNTFPGFTPRSQVPRMAAAAGIGYPELVEQLVETALATAEPHRIRRRLGVATDRNTSPAPVA
ncbi:D-alanine--D-alanine ligase family protein [Protaetiibacter intestinalis]|uniref:D-alanine--D-alanine ligase n=1 Tax=Protaetiibacter intestinalis TaxID=2419774 RepID=A0A387B684_9MICO|nr:D-alanine--D-alanine ligase [Protaetiibacter intestinalis]AYF97268.1 D-alanine--D-alanine ligase [Protaetiibacter intestinalis]